MKGFKKDGKFRPTEKRYTKNSLTKKSLDKKSLSSPSGKGHEMREKKSLNKDIDISKHNWGLEITDGKIEEVNLGNWTDAGWNWSLSGDDARESANTFLIRVADSGVEEEFLQEVEEQGIDFNIFKKQILKNLSGELKDDEISDDGLYTLSGDNSNWKFGQDSEGTWEGAEDGFFQDIDYTDKERELIVDQAYMEDSGYHYADWLEDHGKGVRDEVIEMLNKSDSFEDYFRAVKDESFTYGILEDRIFEGENNKIYDALYKAETKLVKEGKLKKRDDINMRVDNP